MSARKNLQRLLFVVTLVFSFVMSALVPGEVQGQTPCVDMGVSFDSDLQSSYYSDHPDNSITLDFNGASTNSYTITVEADRGIGIISTPYVLESST
ncbi:MAG: hypothetical protein WAU07_05125, partial [Microgenomates group bacterium]